MQIEKPGGNCPDINELSGHEWIGEGPCGAVFRVVDAAGNPFALKILNDAMVNRGLLINTTALLRTGGWPDGVMPVITMDLHGQPAFLVSPLAADVGADGTLTPRSLQYQLAEFPGPDSWHIVKAIASALAAMHTRHAPHGNLKPGNVFLDGHGGVQLRDWSLGHMPGTAATGFTDALLYQPPGQLRDPASFTADGFRCDVHAFGVLAFRLLTGKFPRCHHSFSQVAPPPGTTHNPGIRADLIKIAANLESRHDVQWPDEAATQIDEEIRGWINRCLALDPAQRPADMCAVAEGFAEIDKKSQPARDIIPTSGPTQAAAPVDRGVREGHGRANQYRKRNRAGLAIAAATAAVFAALWIQGTDEIKNLKSKHAGHIGTLESKVAELTTGKSAAEIQAAETAHAMVDEREIWASRLKASQLAGDRMFTWLIEQDHRKMPPLDGRETRLKWIGQSFDDFAKGIAEEPELMDELALARLRLAEISLSLSDPDTAATRIDLAARLWENPPRDPTINLRLATARLWLAFVLQEQSKPHAAAAFAKAREALKAVPRDDVDAARLDFLIALLDLQEALLHAARGDDTRALEQIMRAIQWLNRAANERPDAALLRSQLAATHLSAASIFDSIGKPGDAIEVRMRALSQLRESSIKSPDDPLFIRQIAAAHGALAEAAMLAGDIGAAEIHCSEAERTLSSLKDRNPADIEITMLKATLTGLRGGLLRDQGQFGSAMLSYNNAIGMLENIQSGAANPMIEYRLALLWWQKGRLMGDNGRRDEEVGMLVSARDMLANLDREDAVAGPPPEQVQRAAAYLAGDLGHALQIAGRNKDAAKAFNSSVSLWEKLAALRPERAEYQEGLIWSHQRRQDLK
jgi:tetratricopeptide (TPR) repeat protein